MKRLIITTVILMCAAIGITVVYFKNLNPQEQLTGKVMRSIPANAALIFEFSNEDDFYGLFKDNQLFKNILGEQTLSALDTLKGQLLKNSTLRPFFTGRNIFISLHPLTNNNIDLLLTTSAGKDFKLSILDQPAKEKRTGLLITPIDSSGKKGYVIYSNILKRRFYLFNKEDNILSGSFSKELAFQSAHYVAKKDNKAFVLLPDQQNSNSLGNLYINYAALNPLFEQLFKNKNTDIFKSFRLFSGLSSLSLNFKSDALMFNGSTVILKEKPAGYINLFINQQPVVNQLKNIFPSTTAYSINFAISNSAKFKADLSDWQAKAGMQKAKDSLFRQIKTETGINLLSEFNQQLGNEFAVVTTRYQEKLGIISVKDGSRLETMMTNLSRLIANNTGQLNYSKLPYYLLGDPFNMFRRPYFIIIDNYLVLANSEAELKSFYDSYINRKFMSKIDVYNQFDNLLAEKSNVTYFVNFKNAGPLLKTDLAGHFLPAIESTNPGWKNFYAFSYQFASSGKNFYTNFCMALNQADTARITPNKF